MLIEIKCRLTAKVLFSGQYDSVKLTVEAAVKAHADLAGADLAGANLARANLAHANLAGANLARANLAHANLAGANLAHAYLAHADLAHANLAHANLARANLARAYLAHANLAGADLAGADLAGANLAGANLAGAYLADADLADVKGRIRDSHELLAYIALRFDVSLGAVAAMIAGRLVGCWQEYTDTIRQFFGEDAMRRLWQAWSQDESWGVVARMREYGWPEPTKNEATEK